MLGTVVITVNTIMFKQIYKVLCKYPLSLFILIAIVYLSFFKPPTISVYKVKYIDKLAHFVMYGGFCSVLWFEYFLTHSKVSMRRIFWWGIVAPIIFSGVVELGQSLFTDYRGGDFLDLVFNSLGVISAVLFSICVTKPLMKKYNYWGKRKRL